jgi:secondary thiamine-phosphate synthase enzyme
MIRQYALTVGPYSRGFHIITEEVFDAVPEWPQEGLMQVFIQHTSAGLCINENADASVRHDFELFFNQLAPEHMEGMRHDIEGPDDMPAHIKSVLSGTDVLVPIRNGEPALGTWQGIYLCEYRNHARKRNLIITIFS